MGMFDGVGAALSGNSFVPGLGQMYKDPSLMQQFGAWAKQNPEQLWMGLDMAGQAFDPNNVAAGVGTQLSQASMMNKQQQFEETQRKGERADWQKQISELLGGGGKQTQSGVKGVTDVTSKLGHNGERTTTFKSNDSSLGEVNIPQAPMSYSLGGDQRNPK